MTTFDPDRERPLCYSEEETRSFVQTLEDLLRERNEIEKNSTASQRRTIQEGFNHLLVAIGAHSGYHREWYSFDLFSVFRIPQEDRLLLLIETWNQEDPDDEDSDHYNIRHYFKQIPLSPQQKEDFARILIEKGENVAFDLKEFGFEEEQVCFDLTIECARRFGDRGIMSSLKENLTAEHRIALARELGAHSETGQVIIHWSNFQFDPTTSDMLISEIAKQNPLMIYQRLDKLPISSERLEALLGEGTEPLEILKKNPIALYELWDKLPFSRERREELKAKTPLFDLERKIDEVSTHSSESFSVQQEKLRDILSQLHELNQKSGVPFSFYRPGTNSPEEKPNLATFVRQLTERCSGEELVTLTSLLIENYFCGTNILLSALYEGAIVAFPHLKDSISLHKMVEVGSSFYPQTPFLTPSGVQNSIERKWLKHRLGGSLSVPQVTTLENLGPLLQFFLTSSQTKAAFIVQINYYEIEHFTSLIGEKHGDSVSLFIPDSIFPEQRDFTEILVTYLALQPFKSSLYITDITRQYDVFSCPIFSINDCVELAKLLKSERSLAEYFEHDARVAQDSIRGIQIQKVKSLPISMMKMTQSLSKVKKLFESSPLLTIESKGEQMSIERYIARQSYFRYDLLEKYHVLSNYGAAKKAAKYFQHILEQVVRKSGVTSHSQLRE
jgi:hypothetical protein